MTSINYINMPESSRIAWIRFHVWIAARVAQIQRHAPVFLEDNEAFDELLDIEWHESFEELYAILKADNVSKHAIRKYFGWHKLIHMLDNYR